MKSLKRVRVELNIVYIHSLEQIVYIFLYLLVNKCVYTLECHFKKLNFSCLVLFLNFLVPKNFSKFSNDHILASVGGQFYYAKSLSLKFFFANFNFSKRFVF